MKPAPFTYHAPVSLDEALHLLSTLDGAKPLAGGQSLVPMMNFRLARPAHLVDLTRIPNLNHIRTDGSRLRVGALVTHAAMAASPLVQERCGLAVEAAQHIGHAAIRNRGTVGGSVAHADPTAEWPLVLTCLDGEVTVAGPAGARTVPAAEFFLGYLTTALMPGELVTEVIFPAIPPGAGWSFQEIARRHGDFALVAAAAVVQLDPGGRIAAARLALGGASPAPVAPAAAERLVGQTPTAALLAEVAAGCTVDLDPDGDIHASAEYRRETAVVLARRVLTEAVARAGGEAR